MHKNMKIEINEQQLLDEVVMELERLGYKKDNHKSCDVCKFVYSYRDGFYIKWNTDIDKGHPLTTLAELKEM